MKSAVDGFIKLFTSVHSRRKLGRPILVVFMAAAERSELLTVYSASR